MWPPQTAPRVGPEDPLSLWVRSFNLELGNLEPQDAQGWSRAHPARPARTVVEDVAENVARLRGPGGARPPSRATTAAAAVFVQLALKSGRNSAAQWHLPFWGRKWAVQWHLARVVGKRFRGCRAKRLYVYYDYQQKRRSWKKQCASPRAPGKSRRTPETPPRHPFLPSLIANTANNDQATQAPLLPPPTRLPEPDVCLPLSSGPFPPSNHHGRDYRKEAGTLAKA